MAGNIYREISFVKWLDINNIMVTYYLITGDTVPTPKRQFKLMLNYLK